VSTPHHLSDVRRDAPSWILGLLLATRWRPPWSFSIEQIFSIFFYIIANLESDMFSTPRKEIDSDVCVLCASSVKRLYSLKNNKCMKLNALHILNTMLKINKDVGDDDEHIINEKQYLCEGCCEYVGFLGGRRRPFAKTLR